MTSYWLTRQRLMNTIMEDAYTFVFQNVMRETKFGPPNGSHCLHDWLAHNELTDPDPLPRSYPPISRSESMGVGLPLNPTETTHGID